MITDFQFGVKGGEAREEVHSPKAGAMPEKGKQALSSWEPWGRAGKKESQKKGSVEKLAQAAADSGAELLLHRKNNFNFLWSNKQC
ncbi:hypothetical protein LZ24_00337 [Desulfobotulus alkaliphilus]|uniref:Uncharacterized protein n=1 Tax=Desulfobotulus alkaliphilus TaxID=622671 RepID=A0A562S8H4_9BACT|nr:hypothetical protein [Desulfobotulus alkaliphilus]TWI76716.1 hypothetical protein LZ24_00337 [Desulfobotulus alkaliphilus]